MVGASSLGLTLRNLLGETMMVRKMAQTLGMGLLPFLRSDRTKDMKQGSSGTLTPAPGEYELLKHSRVKGIQTYFLTGIDCYIGKLPKDRNTRR